MTTIRKEYCKGVIERAPAILDRLQDQLSQILDDLARNSFLQRASITATLASGANTISHNLKRQPIGWIVSDKNANINVWRSAWNTTTITINASGAVTVTLLIF